MRCKDLFVFLHKPDLQDCLHVKSACSCLCIVIECNCPAYCQCERTTSAHILDDLWSCLLQTEKMDAKCVTWQEANMKMELANMIFDDLIEDTGLAFCAAHHMPVPAQV